MLQLLQLLQKLHLFHSLLQSGLSLLVQLKFYTGVMWERITTAGGTLGGICAYFLDINLMHVAEIALFAFIGSAVGEAVKETVKYVKAWKEKYKTPTEPKI